MALNFNGYDANYITITKMTDTPLRGPVALETNSKVSKSPNGTEIYMVCVSDKGKTATVQTRGYIELPYTGTAPVVGRTKLAADGNGGAIASTNGTVKTVIKVDTRNKIVGFIL